MSTKITTLIFLIALIITPLTPLSTSGTVGIHPDFPHARVVVTRILGGDTFHISPPVCVNGKYRTVVRLADIQATQGEISRIALRDLLADHNYVVYLDIANYNRNQGCGSGLVDRVGRVVAVAYVRINDNQLQNINKWLVAKGYATIQDQPDNDFDPNKWSLHVTYDISMERLPSITRIPICTNCNIAYSEYWGVAVGISPDRKYMVIAYSIWGDWRLRYNITNNQGEIVRSGVVPGTSLHIGYSYVAANDSGFFITWRDHTTGPHRARFVYIPYDTSLPLFDPADVFGGSWNGVPIATWNPYNNTWVVVYGNQTTAFTPRYFVNFVSTRGTPAGHAPEQWLSPSGGHNRTGYDILGGLILDHQTKKIVFVARNESPAETINMEINVFPAEKPGVLEGADIRRVYIDTGGRGPEPIMFNTSATNSFTRFLLWPSIYTSLLRSGGYVLTVYNDTSTSLSYAVINIMPDTPEVVKKSLLINRGAPTTYYPWVASNNTAWFVAWSAAGWVNASVILPSGDIGRSYVLADYSASYVRVAYDEWTEDAQARGKFIIAYAVLVYNKTLDALHRNSYVAFYNATNDYIEPWILPLGRNSTPIRIATLKGESQSGIDKIAILALEHGTPQSLVLYLIEETYSELQNPIPIPEPWFLVVVISAVVIVATYFVMFRDKWTPI